MAVSQKRYDKPVNNISLPHDNFGQFSIELLYKKTRVFHFFVYYFYILAIFWTEIRHSYLPLPSIFLKRSTLSLTGGCVLKRDARPSALKGFTMKILALVLVACIGCTFAAFSNFKRASARP